MGVRCLSNLEIGLPESSVPEQLPDEYTPESLEELERVAAALKGLASNMSSTYEATRLIEDLHELQEELEITKAIAEEERLEMEVLLETKSLLVLQSQRHAAELPSECGMLCTPFATSFFQLTGCTHLVV